MGDGRGFCCRPRLRALAGAGVDGAVTFDGQRFECGNYISHAAAQQAGRLFVQRKEVKRWGRGGGLGGREGWRAGSASAGRM